MAVGVRRTRGGVNVFSTITFGGALCAKKPYRYILALEYGLVWQTRIHTIVWVYILSSRGQTT